MDSPLHTRLAFDTKTPSFDRVGNSLFPHPQQVDASEHNKLPQCPFVSLQAIARLDPSSSIIRTSSNPAQALVVKPKMVIFDVGCTDGVAPI
jgi:hypothetical protein